MKVATWNVNSIRTRLEHVLRYLKESEIDVLLLQETKIDEDAFPWVELDALGYRVLALGEKAYNGVAIVSRLPTGEVVRSLPGDPADEETRFLQCTVAGSVRVVTCYVPNGVNVGTERWDYKLNWYGRLRSYLERFSADDRLLLGGDFNIAPLEIDCYRPDLWAHSVLMHPDGRAAFGRLLEWGLCDLFRLRHPDQKGRYSWWDYSPRTFGKNEGLRIDHLLASPALARVCLDCDIDAGPRGWKRPSDHTPVWATFQD